MVPLLLLPVARVALASTWSAQPVVEGAPLVMPFSAGPLGAPHPGGQEVVRLTDKKRLTACGLVDDHGVIVLHALAEDAASALGHADDESTRKDLFTVITSHGLPCGEVVVLQREATTIASPHARMEAVTTSSPTQRGAWLSRSNEGTPMIGADPSRPDGKPAPEGPDHGLATVA